MKVFRMNDCDWVCAENEEQAKEFYAKETGFEKEEVETDFTSWGEVPLSDTMYVSLNDLPSEEMFMPQVTKEYCGKTFVRKSFEWVIKHENIKNPCIISSTEY